MYIWLKGSILEFLKSAQLGGLHVYNIQIYGTIPFTNKQEYFSDRKISYTVLTALEDMQ